MPVVQVSSIAPVYIPNNGEFALSGQNAGTSPIYIGGRADLSITDYEIVVSPGASFSWPQGKTLYAIVSSGFVNLNYVTNGSSVGSLAPPPQPTFTTIQGLQSLPDVSGTTWYETNPLDFSNYASVMVHVTCNTGDPNYPNGPDTISQLTLQIAPIAGEGLFGPVGSEQVVTYAYGAETWWIFNPKYTQAYLSFWKFAHSTATGRFGDIQYEVFGTDKYLPADFQTVPAFVANTQFSYQVPYKVGAFPGVWGASFNIGAALNTPQPMYALPVGNGEFQFNYDITYQSPTANDIMAFSFWSFGLSSGFGQYNDYATLKFQATIPYTAAINTPQRMRGALPAFKHKNNRLFLELDLGDGQWANGALLTMNIENLTLAASKFQ